MSVLLPSTCRCGGNFRFTVVEKLQDGRMNLRAACDGDCRQSFLLALTAADAADWLALEREKANAKR